MADFEKIQEAMKGLRYKRILMKQADVMDYGIVPREPYVGMENERLEGAGQRDGAVPQEVAAKDAPAEPDDGKGGIPASLSLSPKPKTEPASFVESTTLLVSSQKKANAITELANIAKQLR